jgi:hypothetical protein
MRPLEPAASGRNAGAVAGGPPAMRLDLKARLVLIGEGDRSGVASSR